MGTPCGGDTKQTETATPVAAQKESATRGGTTRHNRAAAGLQREMSHVLSSNGDTSRGGSPRTRSVTQVYVGFLGSPGLAAGTPRGFLNMLG